MSTTNQGRDIAAVFAAVSIEDLGQVAATIRAEVESHPSAAVYPEALGCTCTAIEAVARLQELGYTITKGDPDGG